MLGSTQLAKRLRTAAVVNWKQRDCTPEQAHSRRRVSPLVRTHARIRQALTCALRKVGKLLVP
jgi:hypothetical protein